MSHSTVDPYEHLQITLNADGSLTRNSTAFPCTTATPTPHDDHHPISLSKDVTINESKNTWVRIFLPRQALDSSSSSTKLPLIIHFHGGGFILRSVATTMVHDYCSNIAVAVHAVIVSIDYRLAPEHRLPAAYDDAMEVLHWVKTAQEEWLIKYVDFTSCFLMGDSAGGNIAYHTGLRASEEVDNLLPLKIKGLILNKPFFGGVKRTESELRLVNDPILLPVAADLMWELSLPVGADRDHEYCNATAAMRGGGGGSKALEKVNLLGWKIMVNGCDGDPLIDRQIEMVKMMEQKGLKVMSNFTEGGHHGFDQAQLVALVECVKNFVRLSAPDADE